MDPRKRPMQMEIKEVFENFDSGAVPESGATKEDAPTDIPSVGALFDDVDSGDAFEGVESVPMEPLGPMSHEETDPNGLFDPE